MNKSQLFYASFLLVGVFISAISQVMLKKSAMKKYENALKEYLNPLVVIAYILFIGTTFLSILAYKGLPISLGPVIETTSYIYVTVFGVTIFKEKINLKKVLSLTLIVLGILCCTLLG